MYRYRLPRRVEVDWERQKNDRVPILQARPNFVFGEPAVTDLDGRTIEGMIGWDPALGWVLNVPAGASPETEDEPGDRLM